MLKITITTEVRFEAFAVYTHAKIFSGDHCIILLVCYAAGGQNWVVQSPILF
jgi:hypothetical protein